MTGDEIVDEVIADLERRSLLGQEKYGTTMSDNPLSLKEWLIHAYEENLDRGLYLKAAINKL